MANEATRTGQRSSTAFFLQKSNPLLCVTQMFTTLHLLQMAGQDHERRMPMMHIAIILYKMIRRVSKAPEHRNTVWQDFDYVLSCSGNERILGRAGEPANVFGYGEGLAKILATLKTPATLVPRVNPFVELIVNLTTGEDPTTITKILEYLTPSRHTTAKPIVHHSKRQNNKKKLAVDVGVALSQSDFAHRSPFFTSAANSATGAITIS